MNFQFIAIVSFSFLMFGGWVANIIKLIGTGFTIAQWGGLEVARVIGVFVPPIGSVLGFF